MPSPKRPASQGRVTIRSVAEAAGVSIATVSFVLNNRPGQVISAPVRKRVVQAAQALGYAPSAAAAGLARKRTRNVAIIFYRNDHQITNPLYSFVVQGAIKEAILREYNILFSFIKDAYRGPDDLPQVVREKNVEGAMFVQEVDDALVSELRSRGIATVAVDSHPYVPKLNTVYVDNLQGGRLACRHLLELGHQKLAFLRAASDRPSIDERGQGFVRELEDQGRDGSNWLLEASSLTYRSGYERALKELRRNPELTAIFCANDELAAGVLRAANELNRHVPGELSVVGFDDIIMSAYVDPPLTTIGFDKEDMGRLAMARLIDLLEGKVDGVARQLLEPELVIRNSTGLVIDAALERG